ncbi:MAG: PA2169 family four-helix-bundle protein [Anaerolineaceae bacterium]|nr:PA2169 family four-helix-bundle protein [Anaerolineaceae bacterium]
MDNVLNPLLDPNLGAIPEGGSTADTEAQRPTRKAVYEAIANGGLPDSLNRLLRVLHETEETYRQAAERARSKWLQGLLQGYSSQREQFVTELSNLAGGLGVLPDAGESVGDVIHQAWNELKAAVIGVSGDDIDVLTECVSSEEVAKSGFEKELMRGLPPHIHEVVQSQYQEIVKAYDQIRGLWESIQG